LLLLKFCYGVWDAIMRFEKKFKIIWI
jgi:hypothetical protein